ncbi:ice-binding family protein [Microbispora sp. NPDC049125]|uniref:ice-binding family protein n=1 Tax=Microbispora sp. NPDC049125 TaxID=3154929 RepID=UPI003467E2B4
MPVDLGSAGTFAVLAGSTVTNTGGTVVTGDLGVSPGSAVTGFPPGVVTDGTIHTADGTAATAQADLTAAYLDAAGRASDVTFPTAELGGMTLAPGVYDSLPGDFQITGTLTLDGQGDPNAVFIFQTASTLVTASASNVVFINGAQPCNVFWQVGSSATLGTGSSFAGNILALASITVTTGVTVNGRTLARNGAVTLDTDTITRTVCTVPPAGRSGTTLSATGVTVATTNPSCASGLRRETVFTATVTAPGTVPTGSVAFRDGRSLLATVPLNSAGQAVVTFVNLPQGVNRITASYLGSLGVAASTSPALAVNIGPDDICLPAVVKVKKKVVPKVEDDVDRNDDEDVDEDSKVRNQATHQTRDVVNHWHRGFHKHRADSSTNMAVVTPATADEADHGRQPATHTRPGGHH